jgi:hypothetical protein
VPSLIRWQGQGDQKPVRDPSSRHRTTLHEPGGGRDHRHRGRRPRGSGCTARWRQTPAALLIAPTVARPRLQP